MHSIQVALGATAIALVLGTLAAFAVASLPVLRPGDDLVRRRPADRPAGHRHRPGAEHDLPRRSAIELLGLSTIVVGHATFCIVVVYNNVDRPPAPDLARRIEEASTDLGADGWQTFRYITFPTIRTALARRRLLAFALSFDEIIVTTFTAGTGRQTLPIWIFSNSPARRTSVPLVNVVALVLILLSIDPGLPRVAPHDREARRAAGPDAGDHAVPALAAPGRRGRSRPRTTSGAMIRAYAMAR